MRKSNPAVDPGCSLPMKLEMWPIDRPKDYPKNARKWTAKDIETVALSIRKFGFRQPLVVDVKDVIVVGHLRRAGARLAGLKEIPVHIAADLTPEQIKAYRLADNKTGELAQWVPEMLASDFLDLRVADFDISLTGFNIDDIVGSVFGNIETGKKTKSAQTMSAGLEFKCVVDCRDEAHQAELLMRFKKEGLVCRALIS